MLSPSTIPECYNVTSDVEDDYSKIISIAQLNNEIKEHRQAIARAAPRCKFMENLTAIFPICTIGRESTKSHAFKETEEKFVPRCASVTPADSAKEMCRASGETKKKRIKNKPTGNSGPTVF